MNTINKLDVIKKLKAITIKKALLLKQKERISQNVDTPLTIMFYTKTTDYKHTGVKTPIQFTGSNMIKYITAELKKLNDMSEALTKELTQAIKGGN